MQRFIILAALAILFIPQSSHAAAFLGTSVVNLSPASSTNVYLLGGDVRLSTTTIADVAILGGTLTVSSPVAGDALLAGGTIDVLRPVAGDLRAFGGNIVIEDSVGGDLAAAGGAVRVLGKPKNTIIAGGTVELSGGSAGPVTVYGAGVLLSGTFTGDVRIYASDHVTLAEGTVIHGSLKYNAPQQAEIPTSAVVDGGVAYTGSSSFLPTTQEAQTFAAAGAGVFFVVNIIAALLAAGLLAGVLPLFARRIADRVLTFSLRRFILVALLGFATLVATPVLILLLIVSFVGIGVAIVLAAGFALLCVLSYLYAAVLAGSALARTFQKRQTVLWRDAVIGMLALQLIGIIPGLGTLVVMVLSAAAAGAIVSIGFSFAFSSDDADASEAPL